MMNCTKGNGKKKILSTSIGVILLIAILCLGIHNTLPAVNLRNEWTSTGDAVDLAFYDNGMCEIKGMDQRMRYDATNKGLLTIYDASDNVYAEWHYQIVDDHLYVGETPAEVRSHVVNRQSFYIPMSWCDAPAEI